MAELIYDLINWQLLRGKCSKPVKIQVLVPSPLVAYPNCDMKVITFSLSNLNAIHLLRLRLEALAF